MYATRGIAPGQLVWVERPLLTYKKDPKASPETFLDLLYKEFCKLGEEKKSQFLELYDPGEGGEAMVGEKWKVCRICNVNEVGGADQQNSVFARYSRLNHSCCRNALGQVGEGGEHTVRALRKIAKGEEVTVTYLEGKLGTKEERGGLLRKKWGFACDCRICCLPEKESKKNDDTIRYVREMYMKIQKGEVGSKSGSSHTKSLQELHSLLASCYQLEEQTQSVLRCVLLALWQGLRTVGARERDWSVYCPQDVRPALEARLGQGFWRDLATYEGEAMRVASLSGNAKKMVEYMS